MNNYIKELINIVKDIDPVPFVVGQREESKEAHVETPNSIDVDVSIKDRSLHMWNNPPEIVVEYLRSINGRGPSGKFIYEPGDYQGWHTNSNVPGQRLYLAWASEENKSGMKFFINNKEIDSPDYKGWNIRLFTPPVWHMVYSNCQRLSLGFIFDPCLTEDCLQPIKVNDV